MTSDIALHTFKETVWDYFRSSGRHHLPWRLPAAEDRFDPYKIMVSELMLQQTQVGRVMPKYHQFLEQFPTVLALAQAPLGEVLRAWSGLGYNRRAKFLWQAAGRIVEVYDGRFPPQVSELVTLPGVGVNTAGAILAYAFKQTAGNSARYSRSYRKQSAFHGSRRQIRGSLIRLLGDRPHSASELRQQVDDDRLPEVLDELLGEALIRQDGHLYHL